MTKRILVESSERFVSPDLFELLETTSEEVSEIKDAAQRKQEASQTPVVPELPQESMEQVLGHSALADFYRRSVQEQWSVPVQIAKLKEDVIANKFDDLRAVARFVNEIGRNPKAGRLLRDAFTPDFIALLGRRR